MNLHQTLQQTDLPRLAVQLISTWLHRLGGKRWTRFSVTFVS